MINFHCKLARPNEPSNQEPLLWFSSNNNSNDNQATRQSKLAEVGFKRTAAAAAAANDTDKKPSSCSVQLRTKRQHLGRLAICRRLSGHHQRSSSKCHFLTSSSASSHCCWLNINNNNNNNKLKMPLLLLILCALLVATASSSSVLCHAHLTVDETSVAAIDTAASTSDATDTGSSGGGGNGARKRLISIKVGALLEESDHEQANMFIRIIKMINERRDETIRQLFNISNSNNNNNNDQDKQQHDQITTTTTRRRRRKRSNAAALTSTAEADAGRLVQRQQLTGANASEAVPLFNGSFANSSSGSPEPELTKTRGGASSPAAAAALMPREEGEESNEQVQGSAAGQSQLPAADADGGLDVGVGVPSTRGGGGSFKRQTRSLDHKEQLQQQEQGEEHEGGLSQLGESRGGENSNNEMSGRRRRRRQEQELEREQVIEVKLEPMIEFLNNRHSALEADMKVCQLIESGVHSLIGPIEGVSIPHVQSICDNMELPYFEMRPFLGSPAHHAPQSSAAPSPFSMSATPTISAAAAVHQRHQHQHQQQQQQRNSLPSSLDYQPNQQATSNQRAHQRQARMPQKRIPHHQMDNNNNNDNNNKKTQTSTSSLDDVGVLEDDELDKEQVSELSEDSKGKGSLWQRDRDQEQTGNQGQQPQQQRDNFKEVNSNNKENSRTLTLFEEASSIDAGDHDVKQPPKAAAVTMKHDDNDDGDDFYNNGNNNNNNTFLNSDFNLPSQVGLMQGGVIFGHGDSITATGGSDPTHHAPTSSSSHSLNAQQQQMLSPTTTTTNYANKLEDLTLNLYPPAYLLTSAYIDLIYAWNWTSFAIVYEEGHSMIKLQDLFRESSGTWTSKWQIKLFQFKSDQLQENDEISSPFHNNNYNNNNNNNNINYFIGGEEVNNFASKAPPGDHQMNEHSESHFLTDFTRTSTSTNQTTITNQARFASVGSTTITNQHFQKPYHQQDNSNRKFLNRPPFKRKKASFRDIFWQIKSLGEQNILLDVKTENLYEALKHAQQVGCMTERYSYLITSLDLHTIDLEDFKYSRTRITALSILQIAKHQPETTPQSITSNNNINDYHTSSPINITNESFPKQNHFDPRLNDQNEPKAQPKLFDEKYLEKLGIHVIPLNGDQTEQGPTSHRQKNHPHSSSVNNPPPQQHLSYLHQSETQGNTRLLGGYKLSPPVVLERSGAFMDPPSDAYKDWSKREMLLSSPASMSLLPQLDRDNEQRLFEFFVEQQERNFTRVRLSTSSAILHDSLLLFMLGLKELDPKGEFLQSIDGQKQQKLTCSLNASPWLHGSSLINYMRQLSFTGLTGKVSFDQRGFRSDFKLDVMSVAPDIGLIKVGEWHSKNAVTSSSTRLNFYRSNNQDDSQSGNVGEVVRNTKSYDDLAKLYDSELKRYTQQLAQGIKVQVPYTKVVPQRSNGALQVNEIIFERLYREQADQVETLIVTTKLSQPYFMLKETPNKLEGNDQYEGFAVDLIHELSKLVNFKYRWREVADKKYGSKEVSPNGTVVWNGMIGEIVRGQADLAIVDLTITAQREEAVDFTLPFMNTGISILFKKPTTKVTTLFSFLSPFSSDVWAYVLAAYCGISANLFFVGHLSPYEWADQNPCRHSNDDDNEAVMKNQFSLLNSFWFTIGSLMQQGSDLTPRSMSTRTIAGIWYFFTLIMISSYTANLAAFLTVEKVVYPIENVRDLSNQEEIKYGCVESGSTCTFFHDSQIETYKKINETIRKFKTYVRSNDDGQKRVEEGKFAFFMESASIEYIVERNCNLTQIGGLLDSKGYGLATSKRSRLKRPYRTLLSEGILHLQETGMLHILKNRWWKERRGGGTCTDDGKGSGVTELSLANVGGVFVVLLGGLGISFLVAIAEFMWRARRSGSTRDGMCEEMMSDLRFALACKSSTKPINNYKSSSSSSNNYYRQQQKTQYEKRHSFATRQQLSLISNSSQIILDNPSNLNYQLLTANPTLLAQIAKAKKDCDPVLLHAMLTMVLQQQQQQQQEELSGYLSQRQQQQQQHRSIINDNNRLKRSQTLENSYSIDNLTTTEKNAQAAGQQQAVNASVECRMQSELADGAGFGNEFSLNVDQTNYVNQLLEDSRLTTGLHGSLSYQQQPQRANHHESSYDNDSVAFKRRFLFANQQQTIDDSLHGGGQESMMNFRHN